MSRYFVILGTMRTGSNLLETTLAQYPGLVCHGEAFNPAFPGKPKAEELLGWSLAERDADPLGFLDHMIRATPGLVPGFRLFGGHSEPVLERVLADGNCARIVLTRAPLESYISLRIAQTTQQWILRNPARRVSAKARFDPADFEDYRRRNDDYYASLRHRMQIAGTAAFLLDYTDLQSREVIDGAARHVGATGSPARLEERIARQNPGAILDKVENPDDLASWLDTSTAETAPAAAAPPPLVAPALAVLARQRPLIYVPVPGGGEAAALAALERLDTHRTDTRHGGLSDINRRIAAGELFDTGLARDELGTARSGRQVFTLICHPAARAYRQFVAQVFPGAETVTWLRQAMSARFGQLTSLRQVALGRGPEGHDIDRQREMFSAFLDMVEAGLGAAGPTLAVWASQSEFVAAWNRIAAIDRICRAENFVADIRSLGAAIGEVPLPPSVIESLLTAGEPPVFPAREVIDRTLEARIHAIYRADYAAFGYREFADQTV